MCHTCRGRVDVRCGYSFERRRATSKWRIAGFAMAWSAFVHAVQSTSSKYARVCARALDTSDCRFEIVHPPDVACRFPCLATKSICINMGTKVGTDTLLHLAHTCDAQRRGDSDEVNRDRVETARNTAHLQSYETYGQGPDPIALSALKACRFDSLRLYLV